MKTIFIFIIGLFVSLFASAQQKLSTIIYGKVTDSSSNAPISGATIRVLSTGVTLLTKADGSFTTTLQGPDTLVLTHTGYKQASFFVPARPSGALTLRLAPKDKTMEEVIVSTGYQSLPKDRATGSFVAVTNKRYNEQVRVNVLDGLEHIANGVTMLPKTVGGGLGLNIRGVSSFTYALSRPLVILDNFPYDGDLQNINPNDVENITILKDAAAASIWGAKAGNGVIVITTKKSRYNQPVQISLVANTTVTEKPDLFYLRQIPAGDYINLERALFDSGYYNNYIPYPEYYPLSPVITLLNQQKNGHMSAAEADQKINRLRNIDNRNDWLKYIYQRGNNTQYNLNLKGGAPNIAWLLGAGYNKNTTTLGAQTDRINLRWEQTYAPVKKLQLTTSVFFTKTHTSSGRPEYGSISTSSGRLPPYVALADERGAPLPVYTNYRSDFIDTAYSRYLLNWNYYPLTDYRNDYSVSNGSDINATIGGSYKITSWLAMDIKYRYQAQQIETRNLHELESYYTRNLVNSFSQVNRQTGAVTRIVPAGDILDWTQNKLTAQNFRSQLSVNKNWIRHSLNAVLGFEGSKTLGSGNSYRSYGYNPEVLTAGSVDYAYTYPNLLTGANAFIPNPASLKKTDLRFVSFYATAAYSYKARYILSASARRDASNIFGLETNDKWKPLWSAGAGWELSKEKVYKIPTLPYLRLRTTYGYQGNLDPSMVAVTTLKYLDASRYLGTPYARIDKFANPQLKWEQVGMWNTGLDFRLKGNRISGSIEYFTKSMKDLYTLVPIDRTTGLGTASIVKNGGKLKGHGLDVEINSVNLKGRLQWESNFILNYYKDKVKGGVDDANAIYASWLTQGGTVAGYPFTAIFAYKWGGLDPTDGSPMGYLAGVKTKDYNALTGNGTQFKDLVYMGTAFPTIYGSLGNSLQFANLSLDFRISYKLGYYYRRHSVNYTTLFQVGDGHADYTMRWQKPGDEASTIVPSIIYPSNQARDQFYSGSEVLVIKGDHIRFQYVNLGYRFKNLLLKKRANSLQLYFTASNLGVLWRANKEGIDPEYGDMAVPAAQTFSAGIKADF
ncbi:SusC/RagA family TonB-linked outer membrane protein [Niabella pedocola]|uniref:SusC/RagA family TonB-linked outer membrane protein n=1 Tax=Niabella pedocola TaxID=1752077 RepID=A0ABS8PTI1_9BACT|nr:SusC/RagA family TonB-linked outer membrane protein [Niabella pedocola]MCD2424391.1 SusC/RagA family TonB-linked outer membrane protein [Niabella pedocola]